MLPAGSTIMKPPKVLVRRKMDPSVSGSMVSVNGAGVAMLYNYYRTHSSGSHYTKLLVLTCIICKPTQIVKKYMWLFGSPSNRETEPGCFCETTGAQASW